MGVVKDLLDSIPPADSDAGRAIRAEREEKGLSPLPTFESAPDRRGPRNPSRAAVVCAILCALAAIGCVIAFVCYLESRRGVFNRGDGLAFRLVGSLFVLGGVFGFFAVHWFRVAKAEGPFEGEKQVEFSEPKAPVNRGDLSSLAPWLFCACVASLLFLTALVGRVGVDGLYAAGLCLVASCLIVVFKRIKDGELERRDKLCGYGLVIGSCAISLMALMRIFPFG